METNQLYRKYLECTDWVIDSRLVRKGSMFFALKGEHQDGHQYAATAIEHGARYVIVDDPSYHVDGQPYILVDNVQTALKELAAYHRKQFDIPVIGITGSNGKTTTKDLLHEVLSSNYKVHTTKGNFNNHLGVPLTLLAMPLDTDLAVVEMGANHVGEIAELCRISDPTHGIITNIGKAHLEGFGGIEGIKKGKGELFDHLRERRGIIFYNKKEPHLNEMIQEDDEAIPYNPETFFKSVTEDPFLSLEYGDHYIQTSLVGAYNVNNICAAIVIGKFFKVSHTDLCKSIRSYVPQNNRSQYKSIGDTSFILDAYNANPASMAESLNSFNRLKVEYKGIILGDMLELGEFSRSEHQRLLTQTQEMKLDLRIFIGEEFYQLRSNQPGEFFTTVDEAKEYFSTLDCEGYTILLKGSRGISVEKIISA